MQYWIHKRKQPGPGRHIAYHARPSRLVRYREALRRAARSVHVFVWLALLLRPDLVLAAETPDLREVRPDQVASGSLLLRVPVQGRTEYREAPRIATDIQLDVVGELARAIVKQTFTNPTDDWVEAVYVFPLPDDAAVDHLVLEIGERRIVGEVHRREQAKRIYETARAEGRKAALLSQERPNLFTTNVANIAPHESVIVHIEYQQSVQRADDTYSIRVPLTLTPRFMPGVAQAAAGDRIGSGWSAPTDEVPDAHRISPPMLGDGFDVPDHRISMLLQLDAGQPLDVLESRYHRVEVQKTGATSYRASLAHANEPADHDLLIEWRLARSNTALTPVFTHRDDRGGYLLARIMPPAMEAVPDVGRSLVLVLDTSGSMQGVSMTQAQAAAEFALATLGPADRFNIIEFDSDAHALFDVEQPASAANIATATAWIHSLQADGGTNIAEALALALDTRDDGHIRQVVFVTDGAVGNESSLFSMIEQRIGQSRLFTVGIGSAPNGWFMRKAASTGRGIHTTISSVGEVSERMRALLRLMATPVLTDIELDWQGVVVEQYPSTVSDLYAGRPIDITAKTDHNMLPTMLTVTATRWTATGPEPWQQRVALDWQQSTNAPVAVAWARQKIESLGDQRRQGADPEGIREAIAEVALAHHLVSEATSLVAVDKTPERTQAQQLKRREVANLMPYGSEQWQSLSTLVPTATLAPMQRLLGGFFIVLSMGLLACSRVRGIRRMWW